MEARREMAPGVAVRGGRPGSRRGFLAGQHRAYTHSVGAVLAVFGISLLLTRGRARDPVRLSFAIAASYASHVLFDWLGADSPAPRGLMALWPFTDAHYVSRLDVFPVVSRKILHAPGLEAEPHRGGDRDRHPRVRRASVLAISWPAAGGTSHTCGSGVTMSGLVRVGVHRPSRRARCRQTASRGAPGLL